MDETIHLVPMWWIILLFQSLAPFYTHFCKMEIVFCPTDVDLAVGDALASGQR